MPIVPVQEMLADAQQRHYAVGYFESWNLESILAVADAAEKTQSPVLLGFSGIYLPHPARMVAEKLSVYAAIGLEVCRNLSVPANLVFNESPNEAWVKDSIRLGFGMVMYTDESLGLIQQINRVASIVQTAHTVGVAVEGEVFSLAGVAGELSDVPLNLHYTDIEQACLFVDQTGVDALAINIGQAHLHNRKETGLDLGRLIQIHHEIRTPLVLHGASSIRKSDLIAAIEHGITKVNVGSRLKQAFFEAVKEKCLRVGIDYNPYAVIGSGLGDDILVAGRVAMQDIVQSFMETFGSAGKAG